MTSDRARTTLSRATLDALLVGAWGALWSPLAAQDVVRPIDVGDASLAAVAESEVQALRFRELGPFRGGRVTTVTGVVGEPHTFYFGATGGGVWKTESGGQAWHNISDGGIEVGSIGAVSVAPSNPEILYVGTGSDAIRGNVSTGRGVYRTDDGGESWRYLGLRDTGQIGRIRIHPEDPDVAWLSATGRPFGPNPERGVYRTRDGGETWQNLLFVSDSTGAIELLLNPNDPNELFAAMWRGERKPWTMISGAREGGIYRSRDAGDSWTKLGGGLPDGLIGKLGIAQAPSRPQRLYAIIEADPGPGIYRSDDGGDSWSLVNTNRRIQGRPWYFHNIFVDPNDPEVVYVAGGGFFKSTDGAESFRPIAMPHSDHHDLWISPDDSRVMVQGNDGGAVVTFDGGQTWSSQLNQPTAEIYMVTVDNRFPYRVYGSQQDNSSISLPSAATGVGIGLQHWWSIGGCETGPVLVHPDDPDVFLAGCFGGRLARYNRRTEQFRQVRPYPERQDGAPERELRYRIQWNAPVTASPHDPDVIYHGSQYVAVTRDQGGSWEVISPDLTRNDTTKFGMAGGPITNDVTGVEIYSALLQIEESPVERGVIWTGSNDGLVHLSRDGGATWTDVTPPALPVPSTVNRIDVSTFDGGSALLTAYRYRLDDFQPYVYRTTDYGASWTRIADGTNGIPADHPTRVVREDPERAGLLYAGTEFGLYVSFDDGQRWQQLQLNLPRSPITDLVVHRGDLVVATQGRGFWILDDVTPLRHVEADAEVQELQLYPVRPAYRTGALQGAGHYRRDHVFGAMLPSNMKAENPPEGATLYFTVPTGSGRTARVRVYEADGDTVRTFPAVRIEPGLNRFSWNLRYPSSRQGGASARAVPGEYRFEVSVDGSTSSRDFEVRIDPRIEGETSIADLRAQFDFLMDARDRLNELGGALDGLRTVREGVGQHAMEQSARKIRDAANAVGEALDAVEGTLIQTEGAGFANPSRIRSHIQFVMTAATTQRGEHIDARPTEQIYERMGDLEVELDLALTELERVYSEELSELNDRLRDAGLDPIAAPVVQRRRPVSEDG